MCTPRESRAKVVLQRMLTGSGHCPKLSDFSESSLAISKLCEVAGEHIKPNKFSDVTVTLLERHGSSIFDHY